MNTTCKYCNEPEDKQDKPGLICKNCDSLVHLSCLRCLGTPGDFNCDVFFEFTCEDCSSDKKERLRRNKFPWVHVILLTLHHLHLKAYGISNHGYFHYKTHLCSFIDRNWQILFGTHLKQKKNWIGTIAGALSVYSNLFFKSGSSVLGESGWWKLKHHFSPAVAMHILQQMGREKPGAKGRSRYQISLERSLFYSKVAGMGYRHLLNTDPDTVPGIEPAPHKKRKIDLDELSPVDTPLYSDRLDSYNSIEGVEDTLESVLATAPIERHYSEPDTLLSAVELGHTSQILPSDSSSITSYQQSTIFYDSDTRTGSPYLQDPTSDPEEKPGKKSEVKKKLHVEEKPVRRENLFSNELNSVTLPWLQPEPEITEDLVEISQYEEIQLLKQVEGLIPKVKDMEKKAYLHRLKAKLALRRLKRHKHLPLFDLDKAVKLLAGYITEDANTSLNAERVLDRFQRSYLIDNLSGTIASTNYGTLLLSDIEPVPFRSAYSGMILKPFIRRDTESKPLWVQLMEELVKKTQGPAYTPRCIEYVYVRPGHVAALNNLCAQHFWPGIDLSESLQYPEYSCVATYGRAVLGCAFLVPRVSQHEAYISFLLVRPHWRRAGLASTMLYHLLQTCTGQDVTLHCSPTNPAIFLYQKFGFKVEELIQDFYEKYYDIDYKGCRHALFLRLVR